MRLVIEKITIQCVSVSEFGEGLFLFWHDCAPEHLYIKIFECIDIKVPVCDMARRPNNVVHIVYV